MPFFVYLLECRDGTFYCGYTKDLQNRLKNHNKGIGSKYTRRRRPVKMIYSEELPTLSAALKREIQIKTFSRKQKEDLVDSFSSKS
jgi:putative endonuclease